MLCRGVGVFSEYHHAGVHDIVLVEHTVVDKKTTVVHCVGRVLFFVRQAIGELQFRLVHIPGIFVDEKTVGKNDRYIGVGRECIYALFEKSGSGDVVAFGNPDVFSPGQFKSFFPLYESRAAIFLVVNDMGYFGVVSVRSLIISRLYRSEQSSRCDFKARCKSGSVPNLSADSKNGHDNNWE